MEEASMRLLDKTPGHFGAAVSRVSCGKRNSLAAIQSLDWVLPVGRLLPWCWEEGATHGKYSVEGLGRQPSSSCNNSVKTHKKSHFASNSFGSRLSYGRLLSMIDSESPQKGIDILLPYLVARPRAIEAATLIVIFLRVQCRSVSLGLEHTRQRR